MVSPESVAESVLTAEQLAPLPGFGVWHLPAAFKLLQNVLEKNAG